MLRPRFPVVLASASPRRHQLLLSLVGEFEVVIADLDEDAFTSLNPWQTAKDLGLEKAERVAKSRPEALVIGGDTVVACPDFGEEDPTKWLQLGKPAHVQDAADMLRLLSGKTHAVITGVGVAWPGGAHSFAETTWVTFRELSDEEIANYVMTGEPRDKAGGYAIQGGAEGFVSALDGSRSNVVGLPVEALQRELVEKRLVE